MKGKIYLYNSLTRKKEILKPANKDSVSFYSCGPTVYWYQHVGNMRAYTAWDIIKRIMQYNNFHVNHVMNYTDVGHLENDADTGEDKMEKAAKKESKSAKEIANYYLKFFQDDFKKLNILNPSIWSKATEHIKDQIELIKKLEKNRVIYKTSEGVYFNSSKFKGYEKLAKLNIKELKAGKRIDLGEKKHKTDFALWKFSEEPGKRQQEWKSPWGVGFPGWHIECSAMSMKYLGETFDIHTGGLDHIPVHHTNEIAQSQAATGKKFVNYWMHAGWLLFKGEKVSKSSGGLYTINDLEEQGFNALEFRYLTLTKHYKKPLNFTIKNLEKSKETLTRLKNIISGLKEDKEINKKYIDEFQKAINDDLNMPLAIQILWKLVRDVYAKGKIKTIAKMDEVLGLDLLKEEKISVPKDIQKLIEQREAARNKKDWKLADELRNKITEKGYKVDDASKGSLVKEIKDEKRV